ncbi:MAG: hypothetical protein ACREEV_04090 [Dongiaceae bacterium]
MSTAAARSGSKATPAATSGKRSIPLNLKPALAHLRPDEHTTLRLEGLPDGMQLSAGTVGADKTWLLTLADLDNLMAVAPAGYDGQSPLSVGLLRRDPKGGQPELVSSFGLLLTRDGAMSAFSGLEPEEREGNFDSVVRLRASVGKGRGKLKVKTGKRPLDFGTADSTAAFTAQRSQAHLDALFRGELAYNDGITSEASMAAEQRVTLARTMWEGEAAERLAKARTEWDVEQGRLNLKISDLEGRLRDANDEIKRIHDEREDWHGTVRAKLIEVVNRLNEEHAAELAQIEQRLKREGEEKLATARVDWERKVGISAT